MHRTPYTVKLFPITVQHKTGEMNDCTLSPSLRSQNVTHLKTRCPSQFPFIKDSSRQVDSVKTVQYGIHTRGITPSRVYSHVSSPTLPHGFRRIWYSESIANPVTRISFNGNQHVKYSKILYLYSNFLLRQNTQNATLLPHTAVISQQAIAVNTRYHLNTSLIRYAPRPALVRRYIQYFIPFLSQAATLVCILLLYFN
jgi:hypothetical protein